ncbi:hydrolase Ecym_1266 [Eremothecium cymbalariae DBVPG|uniref:Glycoside hydrolase family 5 C-terminal domain-containing protein n=1 Tax=Eremothecium cymbalariae (strain CBS 270.75 / DBVPG 7215 / KCTC 17166 / NRRL Y-17582) TaxID=931890 RepID=G8JN44_ERECY|nr:hypothetical protein Ecym_1266 [Eremothecium cymbalariae DBVPG\
MERICISPEGEFTDEYGNVIQLRGVNLDPSNKLPNYPLITTNTPLEEEFWDDAKNVSFANPNLNIKEAEEHIKRLRLLGYNCIRYCFTWEALEHGGPGIYDEEYLKYTVEFLRVIRKVGGIYVYFDPHQDTWSRFSGGSGAPLWTFHCAGLQPKRFQITDAAVLHNHYFDMKSKKEFMEYPKMIWTTNYFRLAAQTMFTVFFGGKAFAPKCIINGVNIQDFLQERFFAAVMTFYQYIRDNAPELFEENYILGLETLNEPSCGYISFKNLNQHWKDHNLRRGTTPTSFQSFQLGEGLACSVDSFEFTVFGAKKMGKTRIDPKGQSAWLTAEERKRLDEEYGWQRDIDWSPGCIWKLHNVWGYDPIKKYAQLYASDYFTQVPGTEKEVNIELFVNNYFTEFLIKYRSEFRKIDSERFLFIEPPLLHKPPYLRGSELMDGKTVYACHYYDGMTMTFKSWNKKFNIDTFGFMRGAYLNPIFGMVFGELNIRRCLRRQFKQIKHEGREYFGDNVPIFFTETGMPYDLEDKKAYQNGDYSSQISANDALGYAIEGNNISYSIWCYNPNNCHEWGDNWNREDFSIWCAEDAVRPTKNVVFSSTTNIETPPSTVATTTPSAEMSEGSTPVDELPSLDYSGFRALDAILRPFPIKINGTFRNAEFSLETKKYLLEINSHDKPERCTIVFLPRYHFPIESTIVKTSSGSYEYDTDQQIIKWCHEKGNQYLAVEHKLETSSPSYRSSGCSVM